MKLFLTTQFIDRLADHARLGHLQNADDLSRCIIIRLRR